MRSFKNKWVVAGGVMVLVALAGGGWWWQQASAARAIVEAALPPLPEMSSVTAEARDSVVAADARARSLATAHRGLAELSRVYHANGFIEAAARCYEGLEQLEPREARWPYRHGTILAGFGEIEPALKLWRRVVELAPDYEPARLRVGDALLKSNQLDQAAATYEEVLKRNPKNAYAQLGLARIDIERQRWDRACERLEVVVAQTNYELGYDLIVSLYERRGEYERAAAIRGNQKASGAYRDPPDPWLDELLDDCYDPYRLSVAAGTMVKEAAAKSLELLQRAIELAPENVGTHYQLGTLLLQQGNLELARQELQRCTTLAPDFSDGWAQLSGLQVRLGDRVAAERTLNEGLQRCPRSPGLHLMRARNLKEAGRIGDAIQEFKISAELRPNEADAFLELGNLLIEAGRTDEGIEQVQLALKAEAAHPMALSILAFHAIMTGDEASARAWLIRVRAQPRVPREQADQLIAAYRQQFGHNWMPQSSEPR